ncbi:MAG: tetratricopeptide repeat protein [Bacteroidales bacterium]|jgi:AraC-like DNA-binding protein/Tfp pilus assembly protein PilF|nr:tetratricopeptide repeat protein [Bacteroidales bacterium]
MLRKYFFCLFFSTIAFAANGQIFLSESDKDNDIISAFKHLSSQQLLDTADHYLSKNSIDTALACYNLLVNTTPKDADSEQFKRVIEAYNRSAVIYQYMNDYSTAYDFLIKALLLCEKFNYTAYKSRIYSNIGNIYYRFNEYSTAGLYYLRALDLCQDSNAFVVILNNLGLIEMKNENADRAFHLLSEALQISKRHNDVHLHIILNSIALNYKESSLCDSAFHYFRLSLEEIKKNNKIEEEADILSNLAILFVEIGKIDSALLYINLSNSIAMDNNFLRILARNHLASSQIEESKGNNKQALKHFRKYATLRDSVFNTEKLFNISKIQRTYEVSKTNEQIEYLFIEQQIKKRTIHYQKIIQFIILSILLLVSMVLLFVFLQNRKLNTAYKTLFEKNIEIIDLQENIADGSSEKYKKSALTHNMRDELLNKILTVMDDTSIVCDTNFSVDKLAELVHSNYTYVSQVINTVLKKNFRSFLNSYRIREAQRLFSEPDTAKYTIESVALQVGFKSRSAFREAFKEITGVSPYFYLKSMREVKNEG